MTTLHGWSYVDVDGWHYSSYEPDIATNEATGEIKMRFESCWILFRAPALDILKGAKARAAARELEKL